MKKILLFLLIALPALLLQSCLHDQEDKFSEASSLRLQETVEEAHKALVNNQTLWVLDYYPREGQYYGGYPIVLKFDNENVNAWRLKEEEEKSATDPSIIIHDASAYKVTNDYGPVLSFDVYNDVIHYFSTPRNNSSWYQAMRGDFEFIIDSVGQDRIKMHGKRSQNTMYLRGLKEDAEEYLTKCANLSDEFIYSTTNLNINGVETPVDFDLDYKHLIMNPGTEKESEMAFCFTSAGLRLYQTMKVNGANTEDLIVNLQEETISPKESSSSSKLNRTPGYMKYEEWSGDFTLTYKPTATGELMSTTVTLELVGDKRYINMKKLNPTYDLTLIYNRSLGTIDWNCQKITTLESGNYILAANWHTDAGSVNYTTSYGMRAIWNESRQAYVWTDRGQWSGHVVQGFIPYVFDSTGKRLGAVTSEYYLGGGARIIPLTFTKN